MVEISKSGSGEGPGWVTAGPTRLEGSEMEKGAKISYPLCGVQPGQLPTPAGVAAECDMVISYDSKVAGGALYCLATCDCYIVHIYRGPVAGSQVDTACLNISAEVNMSEVAGHIGSYSGEHCQTLCRCYVTGNCNLIVSTNQHILS